MEESVTQATQLSLTPLTLNIEGMDHFGHSVVFAKVADGPAKERLHTLAGQWTGWA